MNVIPIKLNFRNMELSSRAIPLDRGDGTKPPMRFSVALDDVFDGTVECTRDGWKSKQMDDQALIDAVGLFFAGVV